MDHDAAHGAADRGAASGRDDHAADRQGALHRRSGGLHRRHATAISPRTPPSWSTIEYEPLAAGHHMDRALAPGAALVDETLAVEPDLASDPSRPAIRRAASPRRRSSSRPNSISTARPTRRSRRAAAAPCGTKGRQHLTMHIGNQVPHPYRTQLARRLRLSESQVTVVSPDIGGGFGQKIALYREELTVRGAVARAAQAAGALARGPRREPARVVPCARGLGAHARRGRPRRAHPRARARDHRGLRRLLLLSGQLRGARGGADPHRPLPHRRLRLRRQGRAHQQVRLRPDARAHGHGELGHGGHHRGDRAQARPRSDRGAPHQHAAARPTCPTAWRPARCSRTSRCARPSRRRWRRSTSPAFRARQRADRERGIYRGLGICSVVESTTYGSAFFKAAGIPGSGYEAGWVKVEPSGAVNASVGLMASGQGYETTFAQVVADALGVAPERRAPDDRQHRYRALRHGQPRRARRHRRRQAC